MSEEKINVINQETLEEHKGKWYKLDFSSVLEILHVQREKGLSESDYTKRLKIFGKNQIEEEKEEGFFKEFFKEIREPLLLLLIFTSILYAVLGEWPEGVVIFIIVLILTTIEVQNEQRARKAIKSLQKLSEPSALVLRNSEPVQIPREDIVPGDILILEAGQRIPADGRLIFASGLAVDESALSGESIPVNKKAQKLTKEDVPLADQANMVFSGTVVTRGSGRAAVVGTGMNTELGRLGKLARSAEKKRTLLQKSMNQVSSILLWVAVGFSIIIPLFGVLLTRQSIQLMILTGLSLAFSTIPEELPIIITMVLALGGYRLSRQNVIIKDLQAVETLGATTVIAADKTGTLTVNKMQVKQISPETFENEILKCGAICNNAILSKGKEIGDPMEIALKLKAKDKNIAFSDERDNRVNEFSFSADRKLMSVLVKDKGKNDFTLWVKGAPEEVLKISDKKITRSGSNEIDQKFRQEILQETSKMGSQGLRVIAFAKRPMNFQPDGQNDAEKDLTFLGLAGLMDPPRENVSASIKEMKSAGIRTLMITGDQKLTAETIATQIGLGDGKGSKSGQEIDHANDQELKKMVRDTSIFYRTTPEDKLKIVKALQEEGERVAVTGDGINDAPALATADIGIAMGETGSDIAREAGDMVLADDNYSTIARAIEEGRHLFANLKKGVGYYLSIKVALVMVMAIPLFLQIALPFTPIQIILMELSMDLVAASAFVFEAPEGDLMKEKPRDPHKPFIDRKMITRIILSALGLAAAVSAVYLVFHYQGVNLQTDRTAAFVTWLMGHVFLASNMRSEKEPLTKLGFFSNQIMWIWTFGTITFAIIITSIPFIQNLINLSYLTITQWLVCFSAALVGTFWQEVRKWIVGNSAH